MSSTLTTVHLDYVLMAAILFTVLLGVLLGGAGLFAYYGGRTRRRLGITLLVIGIALQSWWVGASILALVQSSVWTQDM